MVGLGSTSSSVLSTIFHSFYNPVICSKLDRLMMLEVTVGATWHPFTMFSPDLGILFLKLLISWNHEYFSVTLLTKSIHRAPYMKYLSNSVSWSSLCSLNNYISSLLLYNLSECYKGVTQFTVGINFLSNH